MATINKDQELKLFAFLARQSELRVWLDGKLQAELQVLVNHSDIEVVRKAQGKSQLLQQMLKLLDEAPAIVDR